MTGPSIDDLLDDDQETIQVSRDKGIVVLGGTKPPQKRSPSIDDLLDASSPGTSIDDLLNGPPSADHFPTPGGLANAPIQGARVDEGGNIGFGDSVTPARVPPPRRGIVDRVSDWFARNATPAPSATTLNPIGQVYAHPAERISVPPVQPIQPAQPAAAARGVPPIPAARADVTSTIGTQTLPVGNRDETVAEFESGKERSRRQVESDAQARSTAQHWQMVATKGDEYAQQLNAKGDHEGAAEARRKSQIARMIADAKAATDPFISKVGIAALGPIGDPLSSEHYNIATGESQTFSPDEQRYLLGIQHPGTVTKPAGPDDLAAQLIGSTPWFLAGGAVGRVAAGATEAALAARAPKIASAIGRLAGMTPEVQGPAIPVASGQLAMARIGEEMAALTRVIPRGLTEGQTVGAMLTYRQAREQGASPGQAAQIVVDQVGPNAAFGVMAELGAGLAGRALGITYDPIGRVFVRPALDRTTRAIAGDLHSGVDMPVPGGGGEVARTLRDPTSVPTSVEEGRAQIGDLLGQFAAQRRRERETGLAETFSEPAPSTVGTRQLGPEPSSLAIPPEPVGGWPQQETPLRSARDIAAPELTPLDQHNAVVMMQEHARQAREQAEAEANDPNLRLELAAQARPAEKQGPLTLAQTLATAKNQVDQGEPLATEYRDAIDKYVDALATVRDVPEGKEPSARAQITMARAKDALNAARKKYGAQLGASAVLALAANDEDLSDEEKKMVGLAGLAVLSTAHEAEPNGPSVGFYSRVRKAIEAMPGKRWDQPVPAADWIGKLKGAGPWSKAEANMLMPHLESAQAGKMKLSRADVLNMADEVLPKFERKNLFERPYDEPVEDRFPEPSAAYRNRHNVRQLEDIDLDDPHIVAQQIANRTAAIEHIQESVGDRANEIEDARRELEYANNSVASQMRDLRNEIERQFPNADWGAAVDAAEEYLREHVGGEGDYTDQQVSQALQKAIEAGELYEMAAEEPTLPDNWSVEEEEGRWVVRDDDGDEVVSGPTRIEALHELRENSGRGEDLGSANRLLPHDHTITQNTEPVRRLIVRDQYGGRFRDYPPTDRPQSEIDDRIRDLYGEGYTTTHEDLPATNEWELRNQYGGVVAHGPDRGEMLEEYVRDNWEPSRSDMDAVENEIRYLADRIGEANERDSQLYQLDNPDDPAEEGELTEEQQADIAQHEREQKVLTDRLDKLREAHERERQAKLNAAPTEKPYEPPRHGDPRFSGTQEMLHGASREGDYREVLGVWSNKGGEPFEGGHWGEEYGSGHNNTSNAMAHVRIRNHKVIFDDLNERQIPVTADTPEQEATIIRKINELRDQIERYRRKQGVVYTRLEVIPGVDVMRPETASPRARRLGEAYRKRNEAIGEMQDQQHRLVEQVRASRKRRGVAVPDARDVATVIEAQFDPAQESHKYGIRPPMPTEETRPGIEAEQSAFLEHEREWQREKTNVQRQMEAVDQEIENIVSNINTAQRSRYGELLYSYQLSRLDTAEKYAKQYPELADPIARRNDLARQSLELDAQDDVFERERTMLRARLGDEEARRHLVPPSAFNETGVGVALAASLALMDSAERGVSDVAISDAQNRIQHAAMKVKAAEKTYNEYVPSAVKRLMKTLGFDVQLKHLLIEGNGHWHLELTPEMRSAIKRVGFPFLGVIAATALPDEAEAETQDKTDRGRARGILRTTAGWAAAASALGYLAVNPKARAALTEFRPLGRLMKALEDESAASPATFYANPIGPVLKKIARYPSAAALGAVGVMASQSDDEYVKRAGPYVVGLAALSAIGSKRLIETKNAGLKIVFDQLKNTPEGRAVGLAMNPDQMIAPEALQVILTREREAAKGPAIASHVARTLEKAGPVADRTVTDVLDKEDWEGPAAQTAAVLTLAASAEAELRASEQAAIGAGARDPSELLPNYSGRRLYAKYEAEAASHEPGFGRGQPTGSAASPRVSQLKHRVLDNPVREAEQALHEAVVSGDPQAISDAQDAVDAAKVENYSKRTELGEIRESSRRIPEAIKQNYIDAANAKALAALRVIPGVVHPGWAAAHDDLVAAKAMKKAAMTKVDKDAADFLINEATVKLATTAEEVTRRGFGYVQLPDTRSWGSMRGAVVTKAIAHELVGFSGSSGYQKALNVWKSIKTKFNPGTSVGNILSNVGWAHIKGLPLWEQFLPVVTAKGVKEPYLMRAAKMMQSYGPGAKELSEVGLIGVGNASEQGGGMSLGARRRTEGLEELVKTTRPETADVLRQGGFSEAEIAGRKRRALATRTLAGASLGAAKGYGADADTEDEIYGAAVGGLIGALLNGKVRRTITKTYGHEDDIFKVAYWLKMVDGGKSAAEATKYFTDARSNFGMGRSRSPVINVLASTTHPFIRWSANALPEFANDVIDHPWRYMMLLGAAAAYNEYSDKTEGPIPESDIPIGQRRKAGYALPGITHLPWSDERGGKAAVDVSRWTPLSAVTTSAPPGTVAASIDENAPGILQPGGPVVDMAAKFGVNVDPWSGRPFLQRDYPARENIGNLLGAAAGTMLPSALDVHADRIREDVRNRDFSKLSNDALGPAGLKPRYIQPGQNIRTAVFELQESTRAMKQDLVYRLRANQNPDRADRLVQQYLGRVRQAIDNFTNRIGAPPPDDVIQDAYQIAHPDSP